MPTGAGKGEAWTMLTNHVKKASDLVTSREATTQGFVTQAREKIRLATPHVRDARQLASDLQSVASPQEALRIEAIRSALLSAAGLSAKALTHLNPEDQEVILDEVFAAIQAQTPRDWRTELALRFALTRGDSLGGSARNLAGASAKNLFADTVIQALSANKIAYETSHSTEGQRKIQSLTWDSRVMVFDRLPQIVGKNIDVIVLENDHKSPVKDILEKKAQYIACGEVKGGIDPAGADEHWKTANSSLERVRFSFGLQTPALFFAAAAIETNMASEIISQLRGNKLTYAANLTKPQQVQDLANWLVSL